MEIDYKEAIAALINPEYDRHERTVLANQIADQIYEGYKKEIDFMQDKYGEHHPEKLINVIRKGLVYPTLLDIESLNKDDLNMVVKSLESTIEHVELLEMLRQLGVAR